MPGDATHCPTFDAGMMRRGWVTAWGLLGGLAFAGCARPAVLPPTMMIPQRPVVTLTPTIEPLTADPIVPRVPLPDIGNAQWPTDEDLRGWKYIVLHHTATEQGSVESIHETHLQKKDKKGHPWQGIGYHFVIGNGAGMRDGEIEPTFRWKQQLSGAHAGVNDYNELGIGVVLVGNFEKRHPTPAQLQAVKRLIGTLSRDFGIPADRVIGHADVKATECPGQNFPLNEVRSNAVAFNNTRLMIQ
jgi:hypothetical protein